MFIRTNLEIYKFQIFFLFLKINDTFRGYVFLINRKLLLITHILNKWYMTSSIQNGK